MAINTLPGDSLDDVLVGLRAVAEPTRLRLLVLCARAELTVTELTQILGQSQPRVSRHLKLLCDAGLLDRFREGAFVFYRLARRGGIGLAERLADLIPAADAVVAVDGDRLEAIKRTRAAAAADYFRQNAARWNEIRSLHVDEAVVEAALARRLDGERVHDLLDIGTGTGRMLELFAGRLETAVGVDLSLEMLNVARVNLERANLTNCAIRRGDMYSLPLGAASFDAVLFHQVLRYADRPAAALAEAARVLRPGGILVVVDFAPHDLEFLRAEHAHRRLGFADHEIAAWCAQAGLVCEPTERLPGHRLTVSIWTARRPASTATRVDAAMIASSTALPGGHQAPPPASPSVDFAGAKP